MKKVLFYSLFFLCSFIYGQNASKTDVTGLFSATLNVSNMSGNPVYELVLRNNFDNVVRVMTRFDCMGGSDSPKTLTYITFAVKGTSSKVYGMNGLPVFNNIDMKNTVRLIPANSEYKYLLKGLDFYKLKPERISSAIIRIRFVYNGQIYTKDPPVKINLLPV